MGLDELDTLRTSMLLYRVLQGVRGKRRAWLLWPEMTLRKMRRWQEKTWERREYGGELRATVEEMTTDMENERCGVERGRITGQVGTYCLQVYRCKP